MSGKQGSATVVIGGQWGDEGKGKLVDALAARHDVVVRYQGGANAGHTIRADGQEYIFHLIPSGILIEGKDCVLGPGLVVDPVTLADEIKALKKRGISVDGRLFLSDAAHLILPYHRLIDRLQEEAKKGRSIGTTGRGIGPAYADKVSRTGLRAEIFRLEPERFKRLIIERTIEQNRRIDALYHGEPVSPNEAAEKLLAVKAVIEPLLVDAVDFLHEALGAGKRLLLEGAQGTLLDIDHGTYPYVTSSNPSIGGAISGSGVPPCWIGDVVGIFKAYCTRVGNGPFPSELTDASRRAAAPARRRVRRHHRPAAPLRLVRHAGGALRGGGERHQRARDHEVRHPERPGGDRRLHELHRGRGAARALPARCGHARSREARGGDAARLAGGHQRSPPPGGSPGGRAGLHRLPRRAARPAGRPARRRPGSKTDPGPGRRQLA